MEQFFIFLSFVIMFSGTMTIISTNPIHSVFWVVLVFINSSGLLISMGFEFIPLMVIIIYVGAIAILFLFVIMMLDILQLRKSYSINNIIPIVILVFSILVIQVLWNFDDKIGFYYKSDFTNWSFDSVNHINNLASVLYNDYSYPFIILSLLLLIAMIGAIVLTLELGLITRRQLLSLQHQRNNSWI